MFKPGPGSGVWAVWGNGTLTASYRGVADDTALGVEAGLSSSTVVGGTRMAACMASETVSRGGMGSLGLGRPSSCSNGICLDYGLTWERPLERPPAINALPLCSGCNGTPIEADGVGLLGRLAPALGSLAGDTIPRSRLDYSMAMRSYSLSLSSVAFTVVVGGLMKDWMNYYSTASSLP
jgi:hypothetical protein